MPSPFLRWIAMLMLVASGTSASAQRVPPPRLAPAHGQTVSDGQRAQDNPLARLMRWPVDCQHGQVIAFASGALAGAVTGWFAYHFIAMGVFAPDSPSKRDAVRTSMMVGAGVVGLYSMYQWHRQCGPEPARAHEVGEMNSVRFAPKTSRRVF